jgi:hypothetical protein
MRSGLVIVGLVAVAMLGCTKETVSSKQIKTGGIAATLEALADSDSHTKIKATLRVGGDESNTYVILDSGDSIQAKSGTETKPMYSADSEGVYATDFATGAENTQFSVELLRSDPSDKNALNNIGSLPRPFNIGALPTDTPSRAAADTTITWDNSGSNDPISLTIEGTCIFMYSKSGIADTGSFVISKGQLSSTGGSKPETCSLKVTMERRRGGTTDPVLDSESRFVLIQRRVGTFNSAP